MSGRLAPLAWATRARLTARAHASSSSVQAFIPRRPFFFSTASSRLASAPIAVAAEEMPSPPSPPEPCPSSSVLLLSPTNEILLLHRVKSSSAFPSAHVFPGGNLDAFHDGDVPAVGTLGRHRDGLAYRLGAIRETFEETGILLARRKGSSHGGELVDLPQSDRDEARKRIHGNKIKFTDWLESIGAEADIDGLVPFTRWVTPITNPKRFTTQMYLYMLPISRSSSTSQAFSQMLVPTSDGGLEHTAADFAPPSRFLSRCDANEIILFPPQYYLLHHLARLLTPAKEDSMELEAGPVRLAAQRSKLLSFVKRVPTAETPAGRAHATSWISWGEKCIGAFTMPVARGDKRQIFSLVDPGPELEGTDRGGDWERVVIGKWGKNGPFGLQVRLREEFLKEEEKKREDSKL